MCVVGAVLKAVKTKTLVEAVVTLALRVCSARCRLQARVFSCRQAAQHSNTRHAAGQSSVSQLLLKTAVHSLEL